MAKRPRFIYLLNSAQRRLQQWIGTQQAELDSAGTLAATAANSGVLLVLDKSDGVSMGELAMALDLAPSAVSGLIGRMEVLDWVCRQPCHNDARAQRVWLRPAGRAKLPSVHRALARINSYLSDGFSDAELQTVARWLRHVQKLGELNH